jgi:hypothetical protein
MSPADILRNARRAADDPKFAATPEGQAALEAAARIVREAQRKGKRAKTGKTPGPMRCNADPGEEGSEDSMAHHGACVDCGRRGHGHRFRCALMVALRRAWMAWGAAA